MPYGQLDVDGQSLAPLPECLRRGLLAIAILASASFLVTTALFFYLSVKLSIWYLVPSGEPAQPDGKHALEPPNAETPPETGSGQKTKFTLSVDGIFRPSEEATDALPKPVASADADADKTTNSHGDLVKRRPNQFLLLVYNLLLADMHQALAFALNGTWLAEDGIFVEHKACFTQGLFVSTGDLSSSMFITFIAAHTYLAIVRGYRMSQSVLYCGIACVWIFVYLISTVPLVATRHGADVGGFFVRAGAWVRAAIKPTCALPSLTRNSAGSTKTMKIYDY